MNAARDDAIGQDLGGPAQFGWANTKSLTPQARVPSAAKWLGAFGAVPFAALAVADISLGAPFRDWAGVALAAYGAVILSFLGGIHWGLAIADMRRAGKYGATFARLGASVAPSLVGWGALLLSPPANLVVLAAAFFGLFVYDRHAGMTGRAPHWYPRLRLPLTAMVVAALMLAALA